jgi:hypothetical protein
MGTRKRFTIRTTLALGVITLTTTATLANNSVHLSYLWHLHQPIYWPEYAPGKNRYQFGKDSVDLKLSNTGNYYTGSTFEHPRNQLVNGDGGEYDVVFDKDDRRNAYQYGGKNSIQTLLGLPDAGAQVSYSGALQENIWSFGKDNAFGYGSNWNDGYKQARQWQTSGGKTRCDMVGLTYHHAFSPLLPKAVLRKEIQIFKEIWWKSWAGNPDKSDHSKGFWPVEAAFSRHMIPILVEQGYNWVVVPNSHLARTCQNYMDVASKGTGGWNIDPPNKADVLGPFVPANQWYSGTRDARGGTFPAPFAYQAHKAKYVNPETGAETKMTIVPMCDYLSYENGYASMGTGVIDAEIAPFNDPARPSIVLMAHDGDNAWGGGSSYYYESVPNLMNEAASKGYHPITVEQFLAWHPVPDEAVVHIEDGAWVNAAGDWGHPQFINWLWPPTRSPSSPGYTNSDVRTWYDLETPGWTEDFRNWAVLMAGANFVETAEQITISQGGSVQAWKIQEPTQPNGTSNNPNPAEQAWHFYLGGLDSGFMYYGTSLDDEVKQTLACNRAISLISGHVLGNLNLDNTPPTVFKPQRFPWNPGGRGFGPLTGYRDVGFNGNPPWPSDFYIWTHAFDVSGVTNITLKIRVDHDGVNPIGSNQNETFAGGGEVGAWISIPMTQRTMPKTNVTGNSQVEFFMLPDYIADYYWAKVTGYKNVLLDYYIEAYDSRGNVSKSDIQHVYVYDDGSGPVTSPSTPTGLMATAVNTNQIDLTWNTSSGATGYIVKRGDVDIATVAGTSYSNSGLLSNTTYCYSIAATNGAGASTFTTNVCATTLAAPPPQPPGTPTGFSAAAIATNAIDLVWNQTPTATGYILRRGGTPIATLASNVTGYTDLGLQPSQQYCYTLAATNNVGTSGESASQCATTFALPVLPPGTPQNLLVTATTPNRVDLTWNTVAGATGYLVHRSGAALGTAAGNSFADTTVTNGGTYCYAVAATNSAGTSAFSSDVCATTPTYAPITIGAGPAIGTDKHGVTWYQEFQDWRKEDLRALDPNNDQYKFTDDYDPGRDIVAFYSRKEADNYYFRVDFFDLLLGAETANVDVYVAIDCATGGAEWFPDFTDTRADPDHPWEICVAVYNATAGAVYNSSYNSIGGGGNYLGSYWRADLDAVEFGIKKSVLTAAGWDGVSAIHFQVFTCKDGTNGGAGEIGGSDLVDAIGTLDRNCCDSGTTGRLTGAIPSTASTSRAKYAAIAHANQSLGTRTGTQDHIYRDLGSLKPGFIRTVETHEMLGVPLNMHLSGTLLSSFLWARAANSDVDGPTFLIRLKNMVASGKGSIIGGVYAEHIMPYFEGDVNRFSIRAFNDLAYEIFGLTTNDMLVMHTPERVFHSNTNWFKADPTKPLKGRPFDDILAGGYVATYLDEVTHLHWWFYPGETNNVGWDDNNWGRWAGGQGNDEEVYHHKVHKINGVLTFLINDREDQSKFGNDDGGMMKDTRYTLLQKALHADSSQITIVFDDWEAYAGNSFGQGANNNADQWHNTIRWAANHPWIEVVNLKQVTQWAQSDPTWVIDHGNVFDKGMQTYEWLKKATQHDYDHWYYGQTTGTGVVEENFFARIPPTGNNNTFYIEGTKKYGDLNTTNSLLHDAWVAVTNTPAGNLRNLAEWTYSAMIYETAWHDENPPSWWPPADKPWLNWFDAYKSKNYQITFQRPETDSYDDAKSTDLTSGWAVRLHGHARKVGILRDAAQWALAVKNGTQPAATTVEAKDLDDDLWLEYIFKNDKVYLCFERWGARLTHAFVYDPNTQDAIAVIGAPVANPAEEHDGEGADNNRCSAFKDRWATTGPNNIRYVDMDYAIAPVIGSNFVLFASQDGQITKRITLPNGRNAVRAEYNLNATVGTLYLRHGFGPNQNDLLRFGDANLSVVSNATFYGLQNSQGGAVFAVPGKNNTRQPGNLPQAGYQNRELPLVEQVELYNTATNFSTWIAFDLTTAQDIDGDGLPNVTELALGTDSENPDMDGDGMPDGFEYGQSLDPLVNDASLDKDGDGQSNWHEFIAGTTANDAASVFQIVSLTPNPDQSLTITWNCVTGRKYTVYFRDSLTSPPDWEMVVPQSIEATHTGTTNYITGMSPSQRFYKVNVVP